MIDFVLHNATTGELYCAHCNQIMFAHETARHHCQEALDAWEEFNAILIKEFVAQYNGND